MNLRAILHVDMDAFYASVEQHDFPQWRGLPLIVGGLGSRGVVATCSYEARRFGVHSALPMAAARRLCPQAILVKPRMARYAEVSRAVFALFNDATPLVEGLSLDEAFLDVTASQRLLGPALAIAAKIKQRVREVTGLACSVGVSHNKWLAKLATELGKPDGLFEITEANRQTVLDPLSVGRLWTVGKVTAQKLEAAGYRRIVDLRLASASALARVVGNQHRLLQDLANGVDARPVIADREEKSMGAETTFSADLRALSEVRAWLLKLCEKVSERARRHGISGRVLTIKLRSPPFVTETRQCRWDEPANATQQLYATADRLLQVWWQGRADPALRLLGVSLAYLSAAPAPASWFGDALGQDQDRIADALNRRFGAGTLKRARSLSARED